MQVLGPGLALFSFLGNVFIPIDQGSTMWHVASLTPMFGVAEVSRAPLTGDLPWYAVVNAVVWLVALRGRCRVADEQGHRAGLSGNYGERRDQCRRRRPGPRRLAHPRGRAGRFGVVFAAVWLVFLVDSLRAAWRIAGASGTSRRAGSGWSRRWCSPRRTSPSSPGSAPAGAGCRCGCPPSEAWAMIAGLVALMLVMVVCDRPGGYGGRGVRRGRRRHVPADAHRVRVHGRAGRRRRDRRSRGAGLVAAGGPHVRRVHGGVRHVGRQPADGAQPRPARAPGRRTPGSRSPTSATASPATCTTSSATR